MFASNLNALISPLSIAPMIDWTYSHFRVFMRMILPQALLYTEMVTTAAIKNNPKQSLFFSKSEEPLALQLGGSDINALEACVKMAQDLGFAEVNLNLGCPSDKVQAGKFGACLMAEPDTVALCIAAMKKAVSIPITAKTRIGIDAHDSYDFFQKFVHKLVDAGCDKLVVHARKAWLTGLSPKQNRSIPPLHYEYVYRIKEELPDIPVVINGNIQTLDNVLDHMNYTDGVMIGRLSYQNPYALTRIHREFFPNSPIKTRSTIAAEYFEYLQQPFKNGVPLSILLKPLYNMAHGMPNAKSWKEQLQIAQREKTTKPLELALQFL